MRTDPLPRLLLIGLTVLSVVACSAAAPTPGAASHAPAAAPTSAPASAAIEAGVPKAWLLVGRPDQPDLHLVEAATGEVQDMAIPDGTPAADWRRVVSARIDGAGTIVRDDIVQPGLGGAELRVAGHWRLPTVGLDPVPAGRSLDGSTIVLVEGAYNPAAGMSRFAILQHFTLGAVQTAGDAPLRLTRTIELPGAFEYDTLSPNGAILYVVQHLDGEAGGRYQVRAIDVATGVMRDGVIVDKTNVDETMAGSPIAQVRRPNGLVLTLYRGPEHPFIHALNSTDAWAVCIDLPTGASNVDAGASLDWGLVSGSGDTWVFAVNASLGIAVEIDPTELAVRRSASIGTTAAAPIVLAKFGHGDVGPTGRRLVPSPDGKLLFAAGGSGLTVIKTADLAVVRTDLAGSAIDALGITPDGRTLFALLRGGRIVAVDTESGRRLGTVPGEGYDRLLAVAPW